MKDQIAKNIKQKLAAKLSLGGLGAKLGGGLKPKAAKKKQVVEEVEDDKPKPFIIDIHNLPSHAKRIAQWDTNLS